MPITIVNKATLFNVSDASPGFFVDSGTTIRLQLGFTTSPGNTIVVCANGGTRGTLSTLTDIVAEGNHFTLAPNTFQQAYTHGEVSTRIWFISQCAASSTLEVTSDEPSLYSFQVYELNPALELVDSGGYLNT